MNGEPKIEIIKPLEDAFGLTKQILFQPFDLKKWFVIGFAAWLANLRGGSYNFNFNREDLKGVPFFQHLEETLSQIPYWMIFVSIAAIFFLLLTIMIVFAWLRARGRFIFIDCIAKNRGAIVEPWREFRKQGNSYFLFALIVSVVMAVILAVSALPLGVLVFRKVAFDQSPFYFIGAGVFCAVVLILMVLAWAIVSHFMVVAMYCRRCLAREGFEIAASLISKYPGEITLYCLFWIAVSIGAAITSCVVMCATCCIALIPYIGTVILLPLFVCLRAYGLLFIRQFGPDYDVWAGISATPPAPLAQPPPLPS